ncbi:MAG: ribosome silencing factor [Planctomycetes bacterium]|nr:ribosome silencing factor [Planctomycetota bacterium]
MVKTPNPKPVVIGTSIAHLAADIILDKKGTELLVLDISECCDLADYMVIATGSNKRQVQAMAEEIRKQVKAHKVLPLSVNGLANGWWVLLDCGSVLVHVMQPEARRFYNLESLWADGVVVRRGIDAA